MLTAAYLLFAIALLVCLVLAIRDAFPRPGSYAVLLIGVLAGLMYDNLALASGAWLGEGELLKAISVGRFAMHGLLTPTLCIFGFGLARRAGLSWAQGKWAHASVCLLASALIGVGVQRDILSLELQFKPLFEVQRYVNVGVHGPPVASIITIVVLIGMGIALWRATGWKWLALGALGMFVAAAIGMGDRVYLGNFGEVILGAACLAGAKKFLGQGWRNV